MLPEFYPWLADELARQGIIETADDRKRVQAIYRAFSQAVADHLQRGEVVRIRGVGTLIPYTTRETKRRNPRTGEQFLAVSRRKLRWRTLSRFSEKLRNGAS